MRRADRRSGAVLLEVLVALVVLSAAAASLTAIAIDAARATESARRADREMRGADAFLGVVTLWPREDLDRRLGRRRQGPWQLEVRRTTPATYELTLRDSGGVRELLRTSVYRPDSTDLRGADAHP